jgi:hypothetical protein
MFPNFCTPWLLSNNLDCVVVIAIYEFSLGGSESIPKTNKIMHVNTPIWFKKKNKSTQPQHKMIYFWTQTKIIGLEFIYLFIFPF